MKSSTSIRLALQGRSFPTCRKQRGISLMMVMICIVLMSLAAVGLVRMVDSGNLIVGNVAFKQATTTVADRAVEAAIGAIVAQITASGSYTHNDHEDHGYYATSLNALDVTGNDAVRTSRVLVDWNMDECAYADTGTHARCITPSDPPLDFNGYSVRYLVTRLCKGAGDHSPTQNECVRSVAAQTSSASDNRGALDYRTPTHLDFMGSGSGDGAPPLYRIVVRAVGPRNTVSVTETYVHF